MTSAAITELSMGVGMLQNSAKPAANEDAANFSDFMPKQVDSDLPQPTQPGKTDNSDVKTAYEKNDRKAAEKIAKDTDKTANTDKVSDEEKVEKAVDITKEIVRKIAKELGVSDEDIEAAMETLSLTVNELLSQGNMSNLVASVMDIAPVDILTDDTLFAKVENLMDQVANLLNEVCDELGIDLSEFEDVVKQAFEAFSDAANMDTDNLSDVAAKEMSEAKPEFVPVNNEKDLQTESNKEAKADNQVPVEVNQDATLEKAQVEDNPQQGNKKEHEKSDKNAEHSQPMVTNSEAIEAPVQQSEVSDIPEFRESARTQEIIDQIADYVKIHRSEQISEMEIALNPASLGNIHLQVASKAGTITAQLMAQDQAVAAALESQIAMLKENLEAAGMRVDAIEVTVASHGFEQNLDQQGKQQEEEAKALSAKKSQRRIMDLNEIDAMDEEGIDELTQAEKLQMEMMRMGGNRLNYQI